ncbi:MAG TPA: hypothetical protein VI316_07405 [Candidatus Dormibacteraeota bacterium]
MKRPRRAAAFALAIAGLGWMALTAVDARAFAASRLQLHQAALSEVGVAFADPGGDVHMVAAVFALAGAGGAVASGVVARGGDAAALMAALCMPADAPRGSPLAPGDLVEYVAGGRTRVAVAVTEVEVLIRGDDGRARVDRLRSLAGDDRVRNDLPRSGQAVAACALSSAVAPDAADLPAPPGRVALGDVNAALEHLSDLAAHPRDADTGWWHGLSASLGQLLGLASRLIGLLGAAWAQGVEWLHDHLGVAAYLSVFLVPWVVKRLLTLTIDLRPLHAVLVWLVAGLLLVSPMGIAVATTTALFAGLGLLTGWWSPRKLGSLIGAAVWNVAVFAVDLATGIDGTRPSSVAMVAFALATDVLMFAKPVGVGVRLAELAGRWPWLDSGLAFSERQGERVVPDIVRLSSPIDRAKGWLSLQPSSIGTGLERGRASTVIARTLDLLTIPWRGAFTAAGPVTDTASAAGALGFVHLGRAVELTHPGAAELIAQAVVPALRATPDLYQVHGGARTVIAAIRGEGPPTWQPPQPAVADTEWIRRIEVALRQQRRG